MLNSNHWKLLDEEFSANGKQKQIGKKYLSITFSLLFLLTGHAVQAATPVIDGKMIHSILQMQKILTV